MRPAGPVHLPGTAVCMTMTPSLCCDDDMKHLRVPIPSGCQRTSMPAATASQFDPNYCESFCWGKPQDQCSYTGLLKKWHVIVP
jgi:hypothetical protein